MGLDRLKNMYEQTSSIIDAIRRIFTFNRWESIRDFRSGLGYPDLYTIFARRCKSFKANMRVSRNKILRHLIQLED